MRRSEMIEVIKSVIITKKELFFEKLLRISKKLVLVLAIFVPVTNNSGKKIVLKKVFCIYWPVWFEKNQK